MFLIRLIIFGLLFYLVYFVVKQLFGSGKGRQPYGNSQQQDRSNQREGDISITYDPRKSKASSKEVGDYVDYEEVKDSKKSD